MGGKPVALAEGGFLPDAVLTVSDATSTPALTKGQKIVVAASVQVPESEEDVILHYLLTDSFDPEKTVVYVYSENDGWQPLPYHASDSYLVFAIQPGIHPIAVIAESANRIYPWIAGGLATMAVALLILRKKKKA